MGSRQVLVGLALAITVLSGCQRADVAELDAHDRNNPIIRRAHDCEQIGDLDGAIRLYEQALLDYPKLASAHLNLALLLQDFRKDFMGAIYHYRQYEMLRPATEKKTLVQDRIRISQQLLVAQMLSSGDVAISREQQKLVAECERLNQRLSQAEGEKAALIDQKGKLEQQLADQKIEMDRLHRLVDRLQLPNTEDGNHSHSVLPRLEPSAAPAAQPPPPATMAPGTLLPLRVSEHGAAAATAASGHAAATPAIAARPAIAAPDAVAHAAPAAATGSMRTYVVQPGDSVFRIAERVYGDSTEWKKVRDANVERIGPDNRLRAGQVLLIP